LSRNAHPTLPLNVIGGSSLIISRIILESVTLQ
jgi:hypothetical protein